MALIENLLVKVFNEGYVKFEGGQLVFKDGLIDVGSIGSGGSGSTNTVVIAYASDSAGNGFTLTSNDTLNYIAFKVVPQELVGTLTAASFAGLWFNRQGIPGVNSGTNGVDGVNGEPGGLRYNYSTTTTEEDPTTGIIRFNNANPALATKAIISYMMVSSVDVSNFLTNVGSGWYFMVKPNTNFYKPLYIFKVTGAITDNDTWLTIPIQSVASSVETFSDQDKMSIQFFGGSSGGSGTVTESSVLAAGNFARFAVITADNYKMIDNANEEVKAASLVYKLPAFTISGVSNLPAANTFPHGAVVRLHQNVLVGVGANPLGVYVVADAVNNVWLPYGRQKLFSAFYGTATTPTLTLTANGKFALGGAGDPVIPAGLVIAGTKLIITEKYRKNGTNATGPVMKCYIGKDTATYTNNLYSYTQTVNVADNTDIYAVTEISFNSLASASSTARIAVGGGGGASVFISLEGNANFDMASDTKVTFDAQNIAGGDTIDLLEFEISWED